MKLIKTVVYIQHLKIEKLSCFLRSSNQSKPTEYNIYMNSILVHNFVLEWDIIQNLYVFTFLLDWDIVFGLWLDYSTWQNHEHIYFANICDIRNFHEIAYLA